MCVLSAGAEPGGTFETPLVFVGAFTGGHNGLGSRQVRNGSGLDSVQCCRRHETALE